MNFDVDEVVAKLGRESIEDLDFEAVSIITNTGERIICWYYPVCSQYCLVGFPFKIKQNDEGKVYLIERYNILSSDTFFVYPTASISMLGLLDEVQHPHFDELCDRWISSIEERLAKKDEKDSQEDVVFDELEKVDKKSSKLH